MASEPLWLPPAVLVDVNRQECLKVGHLHGVRDAGLLESACEKPKLACAPRASYIDRLALGDGYMDAHGDPNRLNKLKFRAWHRGFLENDLILGPFADKHVAGLSPEDLDLFEVLLEVPDQDLYGWIVGMKPIPPEYDTPLMARICAFRFEAHAARTAVLNA